MPRLVRVSAGRLVDGTGRPSIEDGAVLIEGERIVEVGPAATIPSPEGAERLAFPDLTLLPGLADCHSHLSSPGDGSPMAGPEPEEDDIRLLRSAENARITLQSGVTTLGEAGAARRIAFSIKDALRRGIIRGPRLWIAGRPVTMTGGHAWRSGGEADGVEGVRLAVRQLAKEGADWIKIMASGGGTPNTNPYKASYSVEELKAAVDQAQALGRRTAAHASCTEGIVNALDAGVDMIFHCSFYDVDGTPNFRPEVARRIANQGVWVNPTMQVRRVNVWRLERLAAERPLSDEETAELEMRRRSWQERCNNFRGLLEARVRMVAGSDAGFGWYRFGEFAHEVSAMAVEGMGPSAALMAATLDCAESMGVGQDVGSLERGKLADLLLVDGDPTVDISALEQVGAVFIGGQRIR